MRRSYSWTWLRRFWVRFSVLGCWIAILLIISKVAICTQVALNWFPMLSGGAAKTRRSKAIRILMINRMK
jgi:hypothetical protein